jgi:DNA-binding MarR family transcriptional regulator
MQGCQGYGNIAFLCIIVHMIATDLTQLGIDVVVAAARLARLASRDVSVMPHAAMRLLGRLDELGPTRISELAKADRCSQPTMSNLVQRQEELGSVGREADPADSRASLISLTDAAIAVRLRQLPPTDLEKLEAAVTVMHSILTLDTTEDSPR